MCTCKSIKSEAGILEPSVDVIIDVEFTSGWHANVGTDEWEVALVLAGCGAVYDSGDPMSSPISSQINCKALTYLAGNNC